MLRKRFMWPMLAAVVVALMAGSVGLAESRLVNTSSTVSQPPAVVQPVGAEPALTQPDVSLQGAAGLQPLLLKAAVVQFHSWRRIKFTNDTGGPVNDLHIEFNTAVNVDDPGPFNEVQNNNTSSVDLLDVDQNIQPGETIRLKFSGQANKLEIKRWWWTLDGKRVGKIHEGK